MNRTGRVLATLAILAALAPAGRSVAQVDPVYDRGAAGLLRTLERLQTTASALHTGAHPDDEDSALLAWLARGAHARTAYLSLTRGDGGQNAIGPELAEALGVIRTEELLQARTLDGAGQHFTRAVDYGYSKTLAEARRFWGEDVLLGDMVRAIRQFRPLIVVSRFTGTPADGHGHHQFAGHLTPRAVEAAADPARYPAQLAEGLAPWSVKKLYVIDRSPPVDGERPVLRIDTGRYDPVSGRTYYQIGMQGRSLQRTQQMGSLELLGPQHSTLRLVASRVVTAGTETGPFDGIDTSIRGIAAYQPGAGGDFLQLLGDLESMAAMALQQYDPRAPGRLVPLLAEGLATARRAAAVADGDARRLLEIKSAEFAAALAAAAGATIDALADAETVLPGDSIAVAVRAYVPPGSVADVANLHLSAPTAWSVRRAPAAAGDAPPRRESPSSERRYDVTVPADALPTAPYWLALPSSGWHYDWTAAGEAAGRPFAPAPLTAEVRLQIGGQPVTLRRAVEFRERDPVMGERRKRIDVVPPITLAAAPGLLIVPTGREPRRRELAVTVTGHGDGPVTGLVALDLPDGWSATPAEAAFELPGSGAAVTRRFDLTVPADTAPGAYRVGARADVDGAAYDRAMAVLDYPHIWVHRLYEPAALDVRVTDIRVADVAVGYVMGSGDRVPEAIERLGLDVTLLDDATLATGDLSRYDTIVIGIRAARSRPAFVAHHDRLLDFARAGGALVVQYQQYDYTRLGLPPFPARMDANVRVTDENAAVTILAPEHPVLRYPNSIGPADFDGWVQERNAYTFTDFDHERYTPLLESHDAGDAEGTGGLVHARLGEGHYVYASYAWFRQLPAGVPGAYRLFANLLSLPEAP